MASKGRPVGTTNRPQFRNFITEAQVKRLVNKAIEMAEQGNEAMLKFCLEQVHGKAVQPLGNDEGKALLVTFDNAFTSSPKNDSE